MSVVRAIICIAIMVCVGCQTEDAEVTFELRAVADEAGENMTEATLSSGDGAGTFYLHEKVLLNADDIESAAVVMQQDKPVVEVVLTRAGGEKFAEITAQNIEKRLGMLVDGRLVCAPVVRDTITGGKAVIDGNFTEEEARRIAEGLSRSDQ